jgi:mannose-6-phosphate isomerase-like protein (cupin superfamily)
MKIQFAFLLAALIIPAHSALAQTAAAPAPAASASPGDLKSFASSADVQELIAKVKAMPPRPVIVQSFAGAGPYQVTMEYRQGQQTASVHVTQGELDYVIDGSGSFITGGTLVDSKQANPTNLSGSGIQDGTANRISKGDWIVVPANTPHQTVPDGGVAVVLMTFHIPGAPAPR